MIITDTEKFQLSYARDLKIGDIVIFFPNEMCEITHLFFYKNYVDIELKNSISNIEFCMSKNISKKLRIIPKTHDYTF